MSQRRRIALLTVALVACASPAWANGDIGHVMILLFLLPLAPPIAAVIGAAIGRAVARFLYVKSWIGMTGMGFCGALAGVGVLSVVLSLVVDLGQARMWPFAWGCVCAVLAGLTVGANRKPVGQSARPNDDEPPGKRV